MPTMQSILGPVNERFSVRRIRDIDRELFNRASGITLPEAFDKLVGLPVFVFEYLESWPSGLLAAVQGVLHDNLQRARPVPVTFAWAPAYDFEVSIWDVADAKKTRGGITILFKSRYPSDQHPLEAEFEED